MKVTLISNFKLVCLIFNALSMAFSVMTFLLWTLIKRVVVVFTKYIVNIFAIELIYYNL